MSAHRLDLTCRCGARLQLETDYGDTLRRERAVFNEQHADCRKPRPAGPDHPTPVEGTHQSHDDDVPTTLGFVAPGMNPWKWGDR